MEEFQHTLRNSYGKNYPKLPRILNGILYGILNGILNGRIPAHFAEFLWNFK